MTPEAKSTIIEALAAFRGDNLYRAISAWRHLTEEQLDEEHGKSGMTRRKILAQYKEHEDRVARAIEEVRQL